MEVELRPTPGECFDQLPVTFQKESYFLAPRSRILVKKGNLALCDLRLPPMYKLGKVWVRLAAETSVVEGPEVLKPRTKPSWKYNSPESLMISGIYSEKDTSRLRDLMLFPIERNFILNRVALGMSGHPMNNHGLSIAPFPDIETLESLAESTWNRMWSKFLTFGTASAGIIGIFMLCRLIKLIVDTILQG